MSKEKQSKEQNEMATKKKYAVLALVVLLAVIGIAMNNSSEKETVVVPSKSEVTENVAEEKLIEEPTIARIDITTPLVNADEPQFEVYVDNSEEPEKQAEWMLKSNVQGNTIEKNANNINIMIKILNDGELTIGLRGPWKRDANGKMIERWVKFVSLKINNEEILSEPTSVWCFKPYKYTIITKAGDKINISAQWTTDEK